MEYIESNMDFSPLFEKNNSIYIEKSQIYKRLGEGIRSVEFITLKPNKKLYFIEAKSSSAKPDNKVDFNDDCNKILEKIQHSLDLFISKEFEINKDLGNEFPICFNENNFNEYKIIFLLIINNHKEEWCSGVMAGLQNKLIALRKIWKIDVVVWNNEKAVKKGFIK